MASLNKVTLIGYLGSSPETRTFQNGGMIATASIATTDRWTDRQTGEKRENTDWHRVVFSNRLAEIAAQYLAKGSLVYVEGKLKTREYQDQQGQKRFITEIRAESMQMIGGRPQGQAQSRGNSGYATQQDEGYNYNDAPLPKRRAQGVRPPLQAGFVRPEPVEQQPQQPTADELEVDDIPF